MERTKFEVEHAMAQNAAVSPGRQKICGGKTDYLRFDTDRKNFRCFPQLCLVIPF